MAKAARLRTTFGRRLRELRRARGLSLETLGEHAGVNDKYVQAVETGRQSPTLDIVEKLAKGLGIHVVALFSEELPPAPKKRVAKLLDQLNDGDLRKLAVVLETIVGQ